jgi:hypothetical protein
MYKQIKLKTHSTSNTETAKLNLTDAEWKAWAEDVAK